MIFPTLRAFREATKDAFDFATGTPVYITRGDNVYRLEFYGTEDEFETEIDPETGEEILIPKENPGGSDTENPSQSTQTSQSPG